jgi:hypothetical protein
VSAALVTAELLAEGRPVRFVHPLVRSAVTSKQTAMGAGQLEDGEAYRTELLRTDRPAEAERLRLLEQFWDPYTIKICRELPLQPAWRCLGAGTGVGSIAYWLAHAACATFGRRQAHLSSPALVPAIPKSCALGEGVICFVLSRLTW